MGFLTDGESGLREEMAELKKEMESLRKDAERWRKLKAETLRSTPRIKAGMGGMWIGGDYLESQLDMLPVETPNVEPK